MKILFDTSVLVAALVESHPVHINAVAALRRVQNGQDMGWIAMHSIAELYSVLTRLPIQPRLTPQNVWQVMQYNVLKLLNIAALSPNDYVIVIQQLVERNLSGGIIYDALLLQSAVNANVERILTLNKKDFLHIAPDWEERLIEP